MLEDMDPEDLIEILIKCLKRNEKILKPDWRIRKIVLVGECKLNWSVGKDWDVENEDYLREEEDLPDEFLDVFVIDMKVNPLV